MGNESTVPAAVVNPLADVDFDVLDPNGWYRYVADGLVLNTADRPKTSPTSAPHPSE